MEDKLEGRQHQGSLTHSGQIDQISYVVNLSKQYYIEDTIMYRTFRYLDLLLLYKYCLQVASIEFHIAYFLHNHLLHLVAVLLDIVPALLHRLIDTLQPLLRNTLLL